MPHTTPPKLLDRLQDATRRKRRSLATERAYVGWCRRYYLFHGKDGAVA